MGKRRSNPFFVLHTGLLIPAVLTFLIASLFQSHASSESDVTPTTEEELYLQCKQLFSEGSLIKASSQIERFFSLYPRSDYVVEMLFMKAFLQPDVDVAVKTYRQIIEEHPGGRWTAKSHFQFGQIHYLQGEYDMALDHYGQIIVSYPADETYWPARYWKCKSLIARGDHEDALAALRSLQGSGLTEVGRDEILMSMGNAYLGMKDYQHAIASYRSLIESAPDSQRVPSAYLLLARGLQNLGKLEEAKEIYQKIIQDYRHSIEARQAQERLNALSATQPKPSETRQAVADEAAGATSASPTRTESFFSIQVGAFSKKRNADNLSRKLIRKGYSVNIVRPAPGKSRLHKVRVGRFKTEAAALRAARRLGRNEGLETDVVVSEPK